MYVRVQYLTRGRFSYEPFQFASAAENDCDASLFLPPSGTKKIFTLNLLLEKN
jgi:hypothetical protein